MSEIYISTDVETDGPAPGLNSMLSLGAAAFQIGGLMVDTFSINFQQLEGAVPNPVTMKWWSTQPEAWEACRQDQVEPGEAMRRYCAWIKKLSGRPVFVAYPVGFDFTFVYWYLMRFTGKSPFGFSAVDIKSLAFAILDLEYREIGKKTLPSRWKQNVRQHNHVALDDAIEQGQFFCAIMQEARQLRGVMS